MPDNRYYLDQPLEKGKTLCLEGDEWHHLTHVMRRKEGDSLEIVNGQGQLATARLATLRKKSGDIEIEKVTEQPEPKRTLILAQAYPLPSKLEWIVEKGTELGASAFWLFPGERGEKSSLSDNQRRRLHQLTISAMKQCGRLYLPPIVEKPPLAKWQPLEGQAFFGDLNSHIPLPHLPPSGTFILFIGPESGFSDNEIKILNKLNAKGLRLHSNILRTETAAICALSLLSQ